MSVPTLLGHHWRRHRAVLPALCAGVSLFEWVLTRLAPAPNQAGMIRNMIAMLPPAFGSMISTEVLGNLTPRGFLGFGYAHPFALLLMSVWAVRVTAGALAGEIGHGTMDLIASRPVSRPSQVTAALIALAGGLAVIAGCGWAGTAVGLGGKPALGLSAAEFLKVAAMCWLTFLAFGGVGLLASALSGASGAATAALSALIAGSFVLDYVARLWAPLHGMRPFSLFLYYQPQSLLATGVAPLDVAVLGGVAAAAALGAYVAFARRDL